MGDSTGNGVNINIRLENITVYGMAIYEIKNANVTITAQNCTFKKPTNETIYTMSIRSIYTNVDNLTLNLISCTEE